MIDNMVNLLLFSFNAHVQVVDLELVTVSENGCNMEHNMLTEPIYKAVLEEKKSVYVLNPRRHLICNDCADNARCLRKLELAFPIKADGVVCGVLGVFCHTNDQRSSVYLDIDASISQINNVLSILEAALGKTAESQRQENNAVIYRAAVANNGKLFIELDSSQNIIDASPEFLKHFEKKIPFGVEIEPVSVNTYNIVADDIAVTASGKFSEKETGSIFLFNLIDKDVVSNSTSHNKYSENSPEIIGESEEINKLRSLAMKSTKTNSVIFISGKPGSGKENIARYIHQGSQRKDGLFIKLNCADFDGSSIYQELYGSKENGITGKAFIADKGILYLQNADFMPKQLLADLVRNIRSGKVVFDDYSSMNMDTRLIFSSKNENLLTEMTSVMRPSPGIIPIYVPQVYKIISDLSHYVRYFTNAYQNEDVVDIILGNDIINLLQGYSWPGNLTELRAIIRQMVDYYDRNSNIDAEVVSAMLSSSFSAYNCDAGKSLKDIENNHISMVVMKYGDSVYEKQLAADELGIGIATLYRKIGYKNT